MAELITICVPTHHRPVLLLHALQSCLAQDYRPLEIDIGDDSENDESEQLISSLALPEGVTLRYWRNRPSLGQAGNVNRLFANARGARLVLMHDDDLLLPGAITVMARAWSIVPDVVAVYGMQHILNDAGELDQAETAFKAYYYKRDKAHVGAQHDLLVSAFWRQFPNNGYLIETIAAREAGYRPFEEIGHACDTDFSIRLAMRFRGRAFYMVDTFTSQYRYNLNSLSRSLDVTWKLYEYLLSLQGLNAAESAARDALLSSIAEQATKENALHGNRRAALKIFFSRFYPRNQDLIKSLYHLCLTMMPQVSKLRSLSRILPRSSPLRAQQRALARAQARALANINVSRNIAQLPALSNENNERRNDTLTITIVSQNVCYGHGQGRANLELAREALKQGHRVNIVAAEVDYAICNDANVQLYLLDVRGIRPQLLRDAIFDWRAQRIVRRLRDTSDIIHINGAVVTASSDVNTAHFVHGSHAKFQASWSTLLKSPYRLYQYVYTMLNTIMERRSFRRSRMIIAVSHTVAEDLAALGVDRQKVFVIYNGIDLKEFTPGHEERLKLGLPPNVTLGIFVGDIKGNRKNLDTVLRALVSNQTVHLAVLANFKHSEAPALAAELGIASRVHFVGERTDVAAVMRSADMLIFPSRYEPFGMVILEALASGLPVIVSRAAGASEIVEAGTGIVVSDPNDVAELSHAIEILARDPSLRQDMGQRGRIVAGKYSWEQMASQYLTRYKGLIYRSGRESSANSQTQVDEPLILT